MKATEQESLIEGRVALAKIMTVHWAVAHAKHIFFAICAIIILLFCFFTLNQRFGRSGRSDYLKVEAAFSAWAKQEKHDLALFKQVSDPLVRHPELGTKFGTLIAQRLLSLGETQLAHEYAQAALKRTKALLSPYHMLFSQNTLLISQGKLQEALEFAYQLKRQMQNDEALWENQKFGCRGGRAVYAYNLLRIASLEREMGSKEAETAVWEEIMQNAGWSEQALRPKTYDPEAFKMVAENFKNGEASLFDYIQQRKKELLFTSCTVR